MKASSWLNLVTRKLRVLGVRDGSEAIYTSAAQRHISLWVRPAWWVALVSSACILAGVAMAVLGYRAAWFSFAFLVATTAWFVATVAALIASGSFPDRTLTAWFRQ